MKSLSTIWANLLTKGLLDRPFLWSDNILLAVPGIHAFPVILFDIVPHYWCLSATRASQTILATPPACRFLRIWIERAAFSALGHQSFLLNLLKHIGHSPPPPLVSEEETSFFVAEPVERNTTGLQPTVWAQEWLGIEVSTP